MAWAVGGNGGGRWKGQELGQRGRPGSCALRLAEVAEGRKWQQGPGPSIPASCCQPDFLGLQLRGVLFAEHNACCADVCNGVEVDI